MASSNWVESTIAPVSRALPRDMDIPSLPCSPFALHHLADRRRPRWSQPTGSHRGVLLIGVDPPLPRTDGEPSGSPSYWGRSSAPSHRRGAIGESFLLG